jgi:hypothetical protein
MRATPHNSCRARGKPCRVDTGHEPDQTGGRSPAPVGQGLYIATSKADGIRGWAAEQVSRSTMRATFGVLARSLHVRLDDASEAALRTLRAQGLSDSEAVRVALREGAARRLSRSALAEEVQRIASDETDRAEMLAIRDHLAELAPRGV